MEPTPSNLTRSDAAQGPRIIGPAEGKAVAFGRSPLHGLGGDRRELLP